MVISCITKVILVGFDENHPYIIILSPKESCMIDNLGLESNTQQAMH